MELIYFVLGMLTILWMNTTYQSFQTNKTNKDIQVKLDIMDRYITETSEEYFKQWDNAMVSMVKVTMQLESIQEQLDDTDLASTLTKINTSINELDDRINKEAEVLKFASQSSDSNFHKTFNDLQSLRNSLNKMGQDPNLMSRY